MLLLSPNKRLVPSLPRAWLSTFPFVLTLGCGICECECINNNYWHTAQNSVSARLRLGRVGFADSQAAAAERSGQRFLDTVYATSGRTEGFKGGFVVFFNGVHIPIPDQLMWLGEAANFNKGGSRLGMERKHSDFDLP